MNLFLWMHFRAWGQLLLWFHEVLMVMAGADRGGGTHTWICWNAQLLLALRSSCARSSWKKGSSRQRKCGRGIQMFISGGINQPYLCRNTRAFTSMDFQQRPSSLWNGMKQLLGDVVQSHLRCPVVGTMPAAGDRVYLEYYSAWSKASSNKPPPTILWFHEKPLKPEYQISLN